MAQQPKRFSPMENISPRAHVCFEMSPYSKVLPISQIRGAKLISQLIHALKYKQHIYIDTHKKLIHQAKRINSPHEPQFLYCATSGSCGKPKIIKRCPESWMRSFEVNADLFKLSTSDTYAILGSLYHSLSLFAFLEAFHIGADIAWLYGHNPKKQSQLIEECNVSVIYATPTQLRVLIKGGELSGQKELFYVRHIFSGGGKLDEGTREKLASLCPNATIHEFYGTSETSFITISDPQTPVESVGKAYLGVLIKIATGDGVLLSKPYQPGEIWVKSPYLFDGYQEETTDIRVDEHGFMSVGDIGYINPLGYVYLKGRKSRMVTIADQNIFPEDIEELLMREQLIDECAILTPDDAKRGHRIVAFIVLSKHGKITSLQYTEYEKYLRQLCQNRLGARSCPKKFIFLPHIPKLSAGKPDLVALSTFTSRD